MPANSMSPGLNLAAYGRLKLIRGAIVLSWEKYGVHLLDAVFGMTSCASSLSLDATVRPCHWPAIRLDDGVLIQIDTLGESAPRFHLSCLGRSAMGSFDITDNFSMFRRMLWEFLNSIETGRPAIPAQRTLDVMRVLIAGRISRNENREVLLDEIAL